MNKELRIKYNIPKVSKEELSTQLVRAGYACDKLMGNECSMVGWLDYTKNISDDLINEIRQMAESIRKKFSALVVVGIGGSYLGAIAAEDFLIRDRHAMKTKVYFAGINLSSDYHEKILREIDDEDVALCIISKSGSTTETLVTGNIFMDYLKDRYGESGMKERIFVVTDPQNGKLRKLADEYGYPALSIPVNIGGRFSVLTSVGLLPMAVFGVDIKEVVKGANSAMSENMTKKAAELAAYRNILEGRGFSVELFVSFEPWLTNLVQWIKQLYGESEGKDGKGMLPVNLDYTKDLHSLGQFVQEGRQIFSETFLSVDGEKSNIRIPKEWGIADCDMSLSELNDVAKTGVIKAHNAAGVPIMEITFPERSPYAFGQAVYFFQKSCAIRGLTMDVDPFNQPGVEKYKEEMRNCMQD